MTAFDDKMRKREQKQEAERKKAANELRKQRIAFVERCLPRFLGWGVTQEDHYSWVKVGGSVTAAWKVTSGSACDSVYIFQDGKLGLVDDGEYSDPPYRLGKYVSVSDLDDWKLYDVIKRIINYLSPSLFPDKERWFSAFVRPDGSFAERQKLLNSLP